MLRRIETYAVRPGAPVPAVARFHHALASCADHVPEVLDCVVGRNETDAPVHLVWEHAFASPGAYRRYMVHPYHATVLDRYILQDSPECVVALDRLGAGLVGYRCDEASFRLRHGLRRLVVLRIDGNAAPGAAQRLCDRLTQVPRRDPSMVVSVAGANTLGPAWFDGVDPISGPPRWTHLWEQGFGSRPAFERYRQGDDPVAVMERGGPDAWVEWSGGIVREVAELRYPLDGR